MTIRERLSSLEPRQIFLPLILLIILVGTIYGIINYQKRVKEERTPTVQVTRPEEGAVTKDSKIVVEGKTSTDASVRVNNNEASLDNEGNFVSEVNLESGDNTITVVSTGPNGKTAIVTRKVTREAVVEPTAGPAVDPGKLSASGPEDIWLLGSGILSGATAAWYFTRKRLNDALSK